MHGSRTRRRRPDRRPCRRRFRRGERQGPGHLRCCPSRRQRRASAASPGRAPRDTHLPVMPSRAPASCAPLTATRRAVAGPSREAHYAYWAYWHGGKRWQYANQGPGEWKVSKGDVEGWRFEPDGSATPTDPPPRAASSATALETAGHGRTTTTSSPPSGGHGAGPVGSSGGGRKDTAPIPFILSVAFILLIGAAALLRSRRANSRAA